ncbi:hypothetical protein ACA29_22195 [Lederbergia galactosidilytica]|uniref:HTH marR-type domain-containing protein n=1 Tax=Lederbergia galactosidilytica TaxID=217031 RepID=A0A0Q9XNQ2_9BACI|nr:hypothetical protein ACA29_22195 [Lederbergia galactosidilytica]
MQDFFNDQSEKNHSKKSLYKYIHRKIKVSKAELLKEFHVPNTTMTRILAELTDRGLIQFTKQDLENQPGEDRQYYTKLFQKLPIWLVLRLLVQM